MRGEAEPGPASKEAATDLRAATLGNRKTEERREALRLRGAGGIVLLPRQRYQLWLEAIFDYFFPFPNRHRFVVLAFDDSANAAISEQLDCDADEFERLTRQLARPRDREDAFRFWREGDSENGRSTTPTYLGILAVLALAASRIDIVDGHRGSFHKEFNKVIGADFRGSATTPGFSDLSRYWNRLADFLKTDCNGSRGFLMSGGEDVFRGGHYVSKALEQVLLTPAEAAKLEAFFDKRLRRDIESDASTVLAAVDEGVLRGDNSTALSTTFKRRYEKLRAAGGEDDGALFASLKELILDRYQSWFAISSDNTGSSPAPTRRRLVRNVSKHRQIRIKAGFQQRLGTRRRLLPNAKSIARHLSPRHEPTTHEDVRLELWLGYGAQPSDLSAIVTDRHGGERLASILADDEGSLVIRSKYGDGTLVDLHSAPLLFELGEDGLWSRAKRLSAGTDAAIVCCADDASALMKIVSPYAEDVAEHCMRTGFENVRLLRCRMRPFFAATVTPESARIINDSSTYLELDGGMKIRGVYLAAAPPRVLFSHPAVTEAQVFLDDTEIGSAKRDQWFALPENLKSAVHSICILEARIDIGITNDVYCSQTDAIDGDVIGYEVSRPANLIAVLRSPGRQPISAYPSTKVRLVIGSIVE